MDTTSITKLLREISDSLNSIDASLQMLAYKGDRETKSFVSKRTICQRLNVPAVTLDKLIFQGITSNGESGLVEGVHYCKADPEETNSSKFLYDSQVIMSSAWNSFKNV